MTTRFAMAGLGLLLAPGALHAQSVPVCDGLTLYANAASSGLCKSISPTTQNLWVCELSHSPDIHVTFSATNAMHITVRKLGFFGGVNCEGSATLTGTFHGAQPLALAQGQSATICKVDITNYVSRLNSVDRQTPTPYVTTAINNAIGRRKVSQSVGNSYIMTANSAHNHCP